MRQPPDGVVRARAALQDLLGRLDRLPSDATAGVVRSLRDEIERKAVTLDNQLTAWALGLPDPDEV